MQGGKTECGGCFPHHSYLVPFSIAKGYEGFLLGGGVSTEQPSPALRSIRLFLAPSTASCFGASSCQYSPLHKLFPTTHPPLPPTKKKKKHFYKARPVPRSFPLTAHLEITSHQIRMIKPLITQAPNSKYSDCNYSNYQAKGTISA